MMTEPGTMEREDSAPVDMLAALFEARGWEYEFVSNEEIVGQVQGSWANYQVRGVWRGEDNVLQLLCLPDIRVPEDKRSGMFEVMGLINEQMWLGHFEMWSSGGVLLYRHALMLGEEGLLGLAQAQTVVEAAVDECDRFYPAFQFLLWGDKSPAEALASALVDAQGEA
jgi:hypothetical protein